MKKVSFVPLFFFALSYIIGILLENYFKLPISFFFISLLVTLLFTAFLLIWRPFFLYLFPFLFFFLFGLLITTLTRDSLNRSVLLPLAKRNAEVTLIGRVVGIPKEDSFILLVHRLVGQKREKKINELVRVYLKGRRVEFGDELRVIGLLSLPSEQSKKFFYYQKILTILHSSPSNLKKEKSNSLIFSKINLIREKIKKGAKRYLPPVNAGILLGILLGDKSYLPEEIIEEFGATGLSHILAVSGLHVGALSLICFWLGKILKIKISLRYLLILLFLLFYSFLTCFTPSVLRASIMGAFGIVGWYLGREKAALSGVSLAALILLIYDPFFLYNLSFQLSFSSVLGILFLYPIFEQSLIIYPPYLKSLFGVSLSAQIGVAPFLVYHFNQFPLLSLLANLLVVPVLLPILFLGLLASMFLFVFPLLSFPFFFLLNYFLNYVLAVVHGLNSFPVVSLNTFSPFFYLAYLFFLVLIFAFGKKIKLYLKHFLIGFIIFLTLFVWFNLGDSFLSPDFKAVFFDVGQGDSAALITSSGEIVLIDGGEKNSLLEKQLKEAGIRQIDLVILSHPHLDHVGGLFRLIKRHRVGYIFVSGYSQTPLLRSFLEKAKERRIPFLKLQKRKDFRLGRIKIQVYPLDSIEDDLNDESLIVRVSFKCLSLLFPGDIEETDLIPEDFILKSTILKVPHHGGSKGAKISFLRRVAPKIAIISVGRKNPFGHPAHSTLNNLRRLGVAVFRTDRDGAISIFSDGESCKVERVRSN